jgi:hypothetical protein
MSDYKFGGQHYDYCVCPVCRKVVISWITNDSNPIQYPALLNTEGQQWQI